MSKRFLYKIFTDPIHGFINVRKGLILKLVDHAYIQRLRRIRQLGLSYLVFPGSEHSRFSHALGAMGLMDRVLSSLKEKNTTLTNTEYEGALAAILLHDVGHGPFSHTLEHTFLEDFNHEMMTLAIMRQLNDAYKGALDHAIDIFTGHYSKPFLHQLTSSQLDIDRLDYIKRDSVYTGVIEGGIGVDRIIKTMRVFQGSIVIEKKGIYAIENYITARRLMYMQVYQHKTVLGADKLLKSIFQRAKHLTQNDKLRFTASPALNFFLSQNLSAKKGITPSMLENYLMLDDNDVLQSIKYWALDDDKILSDLSARFLNRRFFRTTFRKSVSADKQRNALQSATLYALKKLGIPDTEESLQYYLFFDEIINEAYRYEHESIWVLDENDLAVEFSVAAETKSIRALSQTVVKPYIVHLKDVSV